MKDHLVRTGAIAPGGASRRARVVRCRGCGRWVFEGLDADQASRPAHVDLTPLTNHGEMVALLAGLVTFKLQFLAGKYEINRRELEDLKSVPADEAVAYDVVCEHRCGVDIAHMQPARASVHEERRRQTAKPLSDIPPF